MIHGTRRLADMGQRVFTLANTLLQSAANDKPPLAAFLDSCTPCTEVATVLSHYYKY